MEKFEKIKLLREELKIKTSEVYHALNISQPLYHNYESGHTIMSKETLEHIANYLNIHTAFLFIDDYPSLENEKRYRARLAGEEVANKEIEKYKEREKDLLLAFEEMQKNIRGLIDFTKQNQGRY